MPTSTTDKSTVSKSTLLDAYVREYCMTGHRPPSIYAFCDSMEISEGIFYDFFTSFDQLEASIWKDAFNTAFVRVDKDEELAELSIRDKYLTFAFAWVEVLKERRSFYTLSFKNQWSPFPENALKELRSHAKQSFSSWIDEGSSSGEIERRFKVSDHYDEALWINLLFITGFWMKDDSAGFEKTDAAIEKSVNLGFDLLNKGSLDSALDLGKFLFQNFR